jgi:hypothetical protein
MAISNGFWPLNLSVESLVVREIVPIFVLSFVAFLGVSQRWEFKSTNKLFVKQCVETFLPFEKKSTTKIWSFFGL